MKLLITGASGQLGCTFKALAAQGQTQRLDMVFKSKAELDITDAEAVRKELTATNYAYCINCAGYTQVDRAETEREQAHKVNVTGTHNLAFHCQATQTVLFHISTDYVFNGCGTIPYTEEMPPHPTGVYGYTKYQGEQTIINNHKAYFILRTSWLYSEFGHNFMKTMIALAQKQKALSVVYDQVGTPTYARDLAKAILYMIQTQSTAYGLYHYSNEGVASWYDFAQVIFKQGNFAIDLKPIRSEAYPTPVKRPNFSVLDKYKIKRMFGLHIPHWQDSLQDALKALNHKG